MKHFFECPMHVLIKLLLPSLTKIRCRCTFNQYVYICKSINNKYINNWLTITVPTKIYYVTCLNVYII